MKSNRTKSASTLGLPPRDRCIEQLEARVLLTAAATAVADLYLSDTPNNLGAIQTVAASNGSYFFGSNTSTPSSPSNVRQLWIGNGTAQGTELLKSFTISNDSQVPLTNFSPISDMTDVNGELFFALSPGTQATGWELWKSDGTSAGTALVNSFSLAQTPVASSPVFDTPQLQGLDFTNVNGTLFFDIPTPNNNGNSYQLWKSDGTATGTTEVAVAGNSFDPIGHLAAMGSTLFFSAGDALWKSDGTAGGTVQLKSFNVNPATNLVAFNGKMYFINSSQLYMSDGTPSGTQLVFATGGPISVSGLTLSGGALYFSGQDSSNGSELWKSDGTSAGTMILKDIRPGSIGSSPSSITDVNGRLFFTANDGTDGTELWTSDGTLSGTKLVSDVTPGSGSSSLQNLTNVNGTLYFSAATSASGRELWKSDGTSVGTVLVDDVYPGADGSAPINLVALGNLVFFQAVDRAIGFSQFVSDGTPTGTALLGDIFPGPLNTSSIGLTLRSDGTLFYCANDPVTGNRALFTSNGTPGSSTLIADIDSANAVVNHMLEVNGTMFISATNSLWRSDGTTAGTFQVGSFTSNTNSFGKIGNTFCFSASTTKGGFQLWKSDGTPAGTVAIGSTGFSGATTAMIPFAGALYYGSDPLYHTDGTAGGTYAIDQIAGGVGSGTLGVANGSLWLDPDDTAVGREIYKSNGDFSGTVLVDDIQPGSGSSNPAGFTAYNGYTYFTANDGTHGTELWRTDGSAAGTTLIKDIYPGTGGILAPSSFPENLVVANGVLMFTATDGVNGRELWRSDGTAAGTYMIKDIMPGSDTSSPANLMFVGGVFYFTANDGAHGDELWTSDGTAAGTQMVSDFDPGPDSSDPLSLYNANGTLFFTANNGATGPKIYAINDTTPPAVLQTQWTYAAKPQSLKLTFTEDVSATLSSNDFQLINTATGQPVTGVTWSFAYNASNLAATLTFTAPGGGVLPDGNYQLQLPGGSVTDLASNPNADYSYNFFALTGDANHDGIVNALDFNALATHYGKPSQTWASGDFNFDGKVNSSDFSLLAARFGTNLQPSGALPAIALSNTPIKSLFSGDAIDQNSLSAVIQ